MAQEHKFDITWLLATRTPQPMSHDSIYRFVIENGRQRRHARTCLRLATNAYIAKSTKATDLDRRTHYR